MLIVHINSAVTKHYPQIMPNVWQKKMLFMVRRLLKLEDSEENKILKPY